MNVVGPILLRIRALFSRKLGVCPFCMRTSGLGTLIAWALYAGAALVFPHGLARILLLILAVAFTLLLSAHIAAYVARAVIRWRACRGLLEDGDRDADSGLRRREFLRLVMHASAYAIAFSLPGAARVFGQMFPPCAGIHGQTGNPDAAISTAGADAAGARDNYVLRAQRICDAYCASYVFHSPCGPVQTCVQSAPPVVAEPTIKPGVFSADGRVKECTCACKGCPGERIPMAPGNIAQGSDPVPATADQKMEDDAVAKCNVICERNTDCLLPNDCKHTGHTLGKKKHFAHAGVITAEAPILSCTCDCVPPFRPRG